MCSLIVSQTKHFTSISEINGSLFFCKKVVMTTSSNSSLLEMSCLHAVAFCKNQVYKSNQYLNNDEDKTEQRISCRCVWFLLLNGGRNKIWSDATDRVIKLANISVMDTSATDAALLIEISSRRRPLLLSETYHYVTLSSVRSGISVSHHCDMSNSSSGGRPRRRTGWPS